MLGLFAMAVIVGFVLTIQSSRFLNHPKYTTNAPLQVKCLYFHVLLFLFRFSTANDFVFQYFGMPNPCVVFDHYPAKIWALMFTSFMLVAAILWAGLLWLWLYGKNHLQSLM